MSIQHYNLLKTTDSSAHYVGKLPSKQALNDSRESLLGLVNYRGCGQLGQFAGPPSPTFSGASDCNFYIIFPVIEPPGAAEKLRLAVDLACWDEYTANTVDVSWNGGSVTSLPANSGATQAAGEKPLGARYVLTDEIAYNLNAVTDTNAVYGYSKLRVQNATVAHLSAWTAPRYTTDYRDDVADASSFDQQFGMKNDAFNIRMPLVGSDDYHSDDGSIGALCQHQNALDKSNASMVSSSAPCVFQYMHPAGIYVPGVGSTTYTNIFGIAKVNGVNYDNRAKARGRDLISGNKRLDLAVVGRWDAAANCTIKIWTSEFDGTAIANSTHTLNAAGAATPTFEINDSFIEYDPTGSNIVITVACDSGAAIEIQSIALFERSMGDTV
jgi:hypothetical protein